MAIHQTMDSVHSAVTDSRDGQCGAMISKFSYPPSMLTIELAPFCPKTLPRSHSLVVPFYSKTLPRSRQSLKQSLYGRSRSTSGWSSRSSCHQDSYRTKKPQIQTSFSELSILIFLIYISTQFFLIYNG